MNLENLKIANDLLAEIENQKKKIEVWENVDRFDNVDFIDKSGKTLRQRQRIWLKEEFLIAKETYLEILRKELLQMEHKFKIL